MPVDEGSLHAYARNRRRRNFVDVGREPRGVELQDLIRFLRSSPGNHRDPDFPSLRPYELTDCIRHGEDSNCRQKLIGWSKIKRISLLGYIAVARVSEAPTVAKDEEGTDIRRVVAAGVGWNRTSRTEKAEALKGLARMIDAVEDQIGSVEILVPGEF